MKISLYIFDEYNLTSLKIFKLLDKHNISPTVITFSSQTDMEEISKKIGTKVKTLPKVIIDGKYVGGYYDLVEYLIRNNIIKYNEF